MINFTLCSPPKTFILSPLLRKMRFDFLTVSFFANVPTGLVRLHVANCQSKPRFVFKISLFFSNLYFPVFGWFSSRCSDQPLYVISSLCAFLQGNWVTGPGKNDSPHVQAFSKFCRCLPNCLLSVFPLVRGAFRNKPYGRGFDYRLCHWNF